MTNTPNETKRLIQQLHALEAQVKASRMAAEALLRQQLIAEAAERAITHASIVDSMFASQFRDEPTWDDQWEVDQARFGEDLLYMVSGDSQ